MEVEKFINGSRKTTIKSGNGHFSGYERTPAGASHISQMPASGARQESIITEG